MQNTANYIPFLHLLDRNAVSLIKDSVAGKIQEDKKKINFLFHLRSLDNQNDYVSPLLSIIEGEKGQEDSAVEKSQCQLTESEAVRLFFRHAQTDSTLLDLTSHIVGGVFSDYKESQWTIRLEVLQNISLLIANPVATSKRKSIENEIIECARSAGLSISDPMVVLCLASLYGSNDARKVIKPKEGKLYNCLSDIHVLSRIGYIKAIAKSQSIPLRVRFVTMDEGLFGVLSNIKIKGCNIQQDGTLGLTISYGKGLFPQISEEEYIALLRKT